MLAPKSNANQHLNSYFLVRLGTMGHVGRFRPAEPENYRRGERVVCRTARGIEVGVTLGPAELPGDVTEDMADGRLLRKMTAEDELLWGHLQQLGSDAHRSCIEWLDAQGVAATLVEVEPLLDGRTLYFHFLSDVAPEVQLARAAGRTKRSMAAVPKGAAPSARLPASAKRARHIERVTAFACATNERCVPASRTITRA